MNTKLLILAIISCSGADHQDHLSTELLPPTNVVNFHLNTVLLPPVNVPSVRINTDLLPPANVANVFHESGITFVTPTVRQLEISSAVSSPKITHAFGFVETSSNHQQLVRTHSSQPVSQVVESSVSALRSPIGIQSNINVHVDDQPSTRGFHFNVHPNPTDVVQARNIENSNHAVHQKNSRTHHIAYKVPLMRTITQPHASEKIARHSIYGVPTQDEINALPVFQNDKFLSPTVRRTITPPLFNSARTVQTRHTNTPTHSNSARTGQTIESIFDTSFHNNRPGGNSHFS